MMFLISLEQFQSLKRTQFCLRNRRKRYGSCVNHVVMIFSSPEPLCSLDVRRPQLFQRTSPKLLADLTWQECSQFIQFHLHLYDKMNKACEYIISARCLYIVYTRGL